MHLPWLEVSAKGLFAVLGPCPFPMFDRSTSPSAATKSLVIPVTRRFRVRPNKTVSLIQPIERELAALATSLAGFRHAALGFSFLEAPIDGKWRACNSGSRKARCSADLPS
ncbi:MAG: hypothetical protein ABSF25_18130, partial [Bryobacteraceae bacterium]